MSYSRKSEAIGHLLWWLISSSPLVLCLLCFPIALAWSGGHSPTLVMAAAHLFARLSQERVLCVLLCMLIIVYLLTGGAGYLIGLAWGVRNRWERTPLWYVLLFIVTVATTLFPLGLPVFVDFNLIGMLLLFGQGISRKEFFCVLLVIAGIGCLGVLFGICARLIPHTSPGKPSLEVLVGAIALGGVLPLCLFLAIAVYTARRIRNDDNERNDSNTSTDVNDKVSTS